MFFTAFPLFMPKSESLPLRDSLSWLFTKELPWANRYCRSLQKSDWKQFAHVALYKIGTGAIHSFWRRNLSFAHVLAKNERFPQKTKERIPNPESKAFV